MPPKFQSSFIPKGPIATSSGSSIPQFTVVRQRDFLGFIAKAVFGLSVLLAVGVVGYKAYLHYSIKQMGAELEQTRAALATGQVDELIRLNDRIVSTQTLLDKHQVLSPLFSFLEESTPKSVRFEEFNFLTGDHGPAIIMKGQAKSYSALALEADTIYKNKNLRDPVFSDIRLDEKGNVSFSLKSNLSPELLSYVKKVKATVVPAQIPVRPATSTPVFVATSTATTTAKVATTTKATTTAPKKTN